MEEEDKIKLDCDDDNVESTVREETMFGSIMRGLADAIEDAKGEIKLPRNTLEK